MADADGLVVGRIVVGAESVFDVAFVIETELGTPMAGLFAGSLKTLSASEVPLNWPQGAIPNGPCTAAAPSVESDNVRNEILAVEGPVSHEASVLRISLVPSEYKICTAATRPALDPPPVCCPGKFVASTVKTFLVAARATVKRWAYCQLLVGLRLLSKGGEPTYWPFTSSWKVLSAVRRTIAEVADLPAGVATVFLNPTVTASVSMEALEVDHIHELPVRFSAFGLGLGTVTLVAQGPDPYLVAT